MKFKKEVNCAKLIYKTRAALLDKGGQGLCPFGLWIFHCFLGYMLEALGLCTLKSHLPTMYFQYYYVA